MKKKNYTFRVILIIIQIVFLASFFFYMYLDSSVYGTGYTLLVSEDSTIYAIWQFMYDIILIPGILTLLGFIPMVISEIVGIVHFFTRGKDVTLLIFVIESIVLEFFMLVFGMAVLGMRMP